MRNVSFYAIVCFLPKMRNIPKNSLLSLIAQTTTVQVANTTYKFIDLSSNNENRYFMGGKWGGTSRKHAYIILTPFNPTFI